MVRLKISILLFGCTLLLLSGCGPARLGVGSEDEPVATPSWVPVATFTPSPLPPPTAIPPTLVPTVAPTVVALAITDTVTPSLPITTSAVLTEPQSVASEVTVDSLLPTATPSLSPEVAVDEPAASPRLIVVAEAVNVRSGPSTDYPQVGATTRDVEYPVVGRNEAGDWWQVCCFDEQPGWLFGALVEVQNSELVAVVTVPPPVVPPTAEPMAQVAPDVAPVADEPLSPSTDAAPVEETDPPAEVPPSEPAPAEPVAVDPGQHGGTAGNFDPNAQYQIVHYRLLGFDDNNGGIFNKGGQQIIFVTVLDQNGSAMDGAIIKNAVADNLNVVAGSKGPGKAEIKMDWDPYKLYIAADPTGAVTSQVSNQMNNPYPHIPDVVGKLGPADNEYAICPTVDDRCSPPFYHAHWSYEITFQKVK